MFSVCRKNNLHIQLCAIIVEKEEDIAAFKDYKGDSSEPSAKTKSSDEQATSSGKAEKEPTKKDESKSQTEHQTTSTPKKEKQQEQKTTTASRSSAEGDRVAASPLARKLAQEKNIDIEVNTPLFYLNSYFIYILQSIQGSGPNGRIVAEDVEKFIKEGGVKAKPETTKGKDTQAAPSKAAKKDKDTGGYDEQKVSELRAVNNQYKYILPS